MYLVGCSERCAFENATHCCLPVSVKIVFSPASCSSVCATAASSCHHKTNILPEYFFCNNCASTYINTTSSFAEHTLRPVRVSIIVLCGTHSRYYLNNVVTPQCYFQCRCYRVVEGLESCQHFFPRYVGTTTMRRLPLHDKNKVLSRCFVETSLPHHPSRFRDPPPSPLLPLRHCRVKPEGGKVPSGHQWWDFILLLILKLWEDKQDELDAANKAGQLKKVRASLAEAEKAVNEAATKGPAEQAAAAAAMDAAREAARNGPKPRQRHPCPENWLPHNLYCWSLLGPLSSNPISDLCIGGTGSSSASPVAPSTGEAGGKASALGSPAALTAVGSNGEHSRREMAHMKREKRKADRKAETTTKFEEKMGESSKHMEQLVGVLSQVVGSNKGSEISATAKAQADLLQQLETMADEDQDTNQRDTLRQKRREVLTGALAQLSGPTSEVPIGGKRSAPGVRSSSECVDLARGSSNAAGHRSSTGSSVAGSSTDSTLGGGSAGVVDMDATDGVVPSGTHRCMHGMPARRRCVSRVGVERGAS